MATLQELVDANDTAVSHLVTQLESAADTVHGYAEELASARALTRGKEEEVHQIAQVLDSQLEGAGAAIEARKNTVQASLASLRANLVALEEQIEVSLADHIKRLDAFDVQIDGVREGLEGRALELESSIGSHVAALQVVETDLAQRFDEVQDRLRQMEGSLDGQLDELAQQYTATRERVAGIGVAAEQEAQAVEEAFDTFTTHAAEAGKRLQEALESGSEQLVLAANQLLLSEMDAAFGEHTASVVDGLNDMSATVEHANEILNEQVVYVLGKVDRALDLIESIKPVLDAANSI